MYFHARRAFVGSATAAGGLYTWLALRSDPADDPESTLRSATQVVRFLPRGLAGAVRGSRNAEEMVLERTVRDAATGACVHLCGLSHIDPAAAGAVRARASALAGALSGVAIEAEPKMLLLSQTARSALSGLSASVVFTEGESRVQRALFELPAVHAWAAEAGQSLGRPEQVPLSTTLRLHLSRDGVLWGLEQAEAATCASEFGVGLRCLRGSPARAQLVSESPPLPQQQQHPGSGGTAGARGVSLLSPESPPPPPQQQHGGRDGAAGVSQQQGQGQQQHHDSASLLFA